MPSRPPVHGAVRRQREAKATRYAYDEARGTASQRGYTSRWSKASKGYRAKHPLCVLCQAKGLIVAADVVDHRVPHKGDTVLFWDRDNWQSLCKTCHDRKTATEDSGFARRLPTDRSDRT